MIRAAGRVPRQRTTFYGDAPAERVAAARDAGPLATPEYTPARREPRRHRLPPVRFGTA